MFAGESEQSPGIKQSKKDGEREREKDGSPIPFRSDFQISACPDQ